MLKILPNSAEGYEFVYDPRLGMMKQVRLSEPKPAEELESTSAP